MNIKQLFLPLFGALALIGCNKEAVEPTSSNDTETQPVRLALTMEATADASEMRAVSFDANQNVPPTTHDQYSDWTTHCFLSNEDGSKKAYATINWDARLEGGKVKLKMRGHELQLLPIGSSSAELSPENKPVAGERWSIVGITGGGKLNEERTRVDFAPDAELDKDLQPHQARVPFTFEKAYFTVSAASGERAPQISVHFEPQGSLLNIYAHNKTAQPVQSELKVITNALSNNGYYDYSTGVAQWKFHNTSTANEVISRSIAISSTQGKHYLLWGMPRLTTTGSLSSKIFIAGCDISAEGLAVTELPRERTEAFDNAQAYYTGVDINESLTALNSLSTNGVSNNLVKVMSKTTNALVDPENFKTKEDADAAGIYYSYDQAMAAFGPGKHSDYYLPTIWELGTIFPTEIVDVGFNSVYFANNNLPERRERVQFSKDSSPVEVKSHYQGAGGTTKVIYALRFYDYDNNSKRTAFRYEYLPNNIGLKITSRYLGSQGVYSIGDIASEDGFWKNNSYRDRTIILPNIGRESGLFGDAGYFWSSTPVSDTNSRLINFSSEFIVGFGNLKATNQFAVIPFKKI